MSSGGLVALPDAGAVEDAGELPRGGDGGIELLDRSGGGIAGVGEGWKSLLVALGVKCGEDGFWEVDLTADFDPCRGVALQVVWDF